MKLRFVQSLDRGCGNVAGGCAGMMSGRAGDGSARAVRFDRVRVGREGVRDGSYDHPDVLSLMLYRLRQQLDGCR